MNRLRFNKYLKLPVSWKSTVYLIEDGKIETFIVEDYDIDFEISSGQVYADIVLRHKAAKYTVFCTEDELGKTVFETRTAAKRALRRELREQKNERR